MMIEDESDTTLSALLDLDGYIAEIGQGWWIKMEARRVRQDPHKPFGVKYSLTLHDPLGERMLGYDNAHSVPGTFTKHPHDHIHKGSRVKHYCYVNAAALIQDFWNDVNKVLKAKVDTLETQEN